MATDYESSVSMWVCLMLSIILILTRLVLRRVKRQTFTQGDYWCLAGAIFILGRLLAHHYLLLYGSTRILSPERRFQLLDPELEVQADKIVTGSKLVLATRSLLICVLWCLKMAVLDLLAKLMMNMPYERKLLYVFRTMLATTFVVALVTVFVGCHPFNLHWQIYPNPGDCVVGNIWLFTYEICNMVTDVLLMTVPFSLIMSIHVPTMQRLRVMALFSIGILLISISIIRLVQGKGSRVQSAHTLWASLEIMFAVIVSVTPTIYSLARNRHENNTPHGNELSIKSTDGIYRGSVVEDNQNPTRVWRELNNGALAIEDTNREGTSSGRRCDTSDAKV